MYRLLNIGVAICVFTLIIIIRASLQDYSKNIQKIELLKIVMLVEIVFVIVSTYQIQSEKAEKEINIPEQTWIIETLEGEEILVNETVMDKYWDIIYLYLYEQATLPEIERQFKLYMHQGDLYCESMLTGYTRIIGTNLR